MQAELRRLFYNAIIAYATSTAMPVAAANVAFDPATVKGHHYLKPAVLNATPDVHGVDYGEALHRWVMQVSIYTRDGIGEVNEFDRADLSTSDIADDIRTTVFPIYSVLVGASHKFKVMTPAAPAAAIPMEGWYSVPVRFQVQSIS